MKIIGNLFFVVFSRKKNMRIFPILFTLLIFAKPCISQNSNVTLDIEDGIEDVLALHKAAWAKVKQVDGFRIQIVAFAGSHANEKATAEKEKIGKAFKTVPCYITFSEPNFRVRIGDFRNRMDACKILDAVRVQFPGAFIVTDKIFFTTF